MIPILYKIVWDERSCSVTLSRKFLDYSPDKEMYWDGMDVFRMLSAAKMERVVISYSKAEAQEDKEIEVKAGTLAEVLEYGFEFITDVALTA